jgi:hypothetical protein
LSSILIKTSGREREEEFFFDLCICAAAAAFGSTFVVSPMLRLFLPPLDTFAHEPKPDLECFSIEKNLFLTVVFAFESSMPLAS